MSNKKKYPKIEHIVLSGAGHGIFSYIGAFGLLLKEEYIQIEKIKSIYGTSAGAMIAILLALNIEWKIVEEYFIERPWNELFLFETEHLLQIISQNGIWDENVIRKSVLPLFKLKDINIDITLKEFFEITKKDIFIYTTQLNNFKSLELSHYSHPTLKLIDALNMSCSVPLLWKPVLFNNKYYIDGGLSNQYPIQSLLNSNLSLNLNNENVFGIKTLGSEDENETEIININFLNLLQYLVFNPIIKLLTPENIIKNELNITSCGIMNFNNIKETIFNQEKRSNLISSVKNEVEEFLNKY